MCIFLYMCTLISISKKICRFVSSLKYSTLVNMMHRDYYRAAGASTYSDTSSSQTEEPVETYLDQFYDDYEKQRWKEYEAGYEAPPRELPPAYGSESIAYQNNAAAPPPAAPQPAQTTPPSHKWRNCCIILGIILFFLSIPAIVLGLLYLKERDVSFTI